MQMNIQRGRPLACVGVLTPKATIFSKPTFRQITHCKYELLHYQNVFQTFMNVLGEWISQWVVYFFTGDLFKYYPFAPETL